MMSTPSNSSPDQSDQPSSRHTDAGQQQLATVRAMVTAATQRLLGDTIAITDEQWHAPSLLPGWTRGHVASHLARQAEGLGRLCSWAQTGEPQQMYASGEQRDHDIEGGAGRTGLELQIDLDTAAGELSRAFESLDSITAQQDSQGPDDQHRLGWDAQIEMRGGLAIGARLLPVVRLNEVVLHHVDLDVGFGIAEIDRQTAELLLEWCAYRLGHQPGCPSATLVGEEDFTVRLGNGQGPRVSGESRQLLGWLTRRSDASQVEISDGELTPPPF